MAESYRGGWVFKQGGALYGPVPTEALVAKLQAGEIGPETLVAKESGAFSPIGTVEPFVAVAASVAAERRAREEAERRGRERRRRRLLIASLCVPLLGVAGWLLHGERDPSLGRRELASITIEALPMVVRAVPEVAEGEWEEIGDEGRGAPLPSGRRAVTTTPSAAPSSGGGAVAAARSTGRGAPTEPTRDVGTVASAPAPRSGPSPIAGAGSPPPADDVSIDTRFDLAAIERVVEARRNQLLPCLRRQAEGDPRFRGEVPLSFVIGQGGRVSRLWVDKPGYRDGELHRCLLGQLQSWRFPPFEGQSPAISLSFRIGG